MKKRIILITIIGLFLIMLPLMAGAEIVDSGECGDNVTWMVDETGLLTISGTGEMRGSPWSKYRGITSVVINEGVTSICHDAFNSAPYFYSISKISIPKSVTKIGSAAFLGCPHLTEISLPDNIDEIGINAFLSWTYSDIGGSGWAPSVYASFNSVTAKTLSLKQYAFYDIDTGDGYKFIYSFNVLTQQYEEPIIGVELSFVNREVSSYEVPDFITKIGQGAFYNSNLQTIVINDSINNIVPGAFDGCKELKNIVIPTCDSFAHNWAKENGFGDSVNIISHQGDAIINPAVSPTQTQTGLTEGSHCSVCGDVVVAQEIVPADSDSPIVERGTCGDNLKWILEDNGTLTISGSGKMDSHPWTEGEKRYLITKVIIQENVTSITSYAFQYCSNISDITIPQSVVQIERGSFLGCSSVSRIIIPDGVTSINASTFNGCTSLESVSIPDSIVKIDQQAFYYCTNLKSITIPSSVTSIGDNAFAVCSNLTSFSFPEGITCISNGVLSSCSRLTDIYIPDSVTSIGSLAFAECSSLKNISIPDHVVDIGNGAFKRCSELASISIPQGIASINSGVFSGCSKLSTIIIPDGVVYIQDNSFQDCSNLLSIYIPGSVTYINKPFSGCGRLASIITSTCNSYAYTWSKENGYSNLVTSLSHQGDIIIDDAIAPTQTQTGLTEGQHCSFCGETIVQQRIIPALRNMTVLELPFSLISVEEEAFAGIDCQAIIIPDGCTTIGENAFAGCTNLLYIKIPASVTSYPANAFEGCNENHVIDWEGH